MMHNKASIGLLVAGATGLGLSACTLPRPVASYSEVKKAGDLGEIRLVPVTSDVAIPAASPSAATFPSPFLEAAETDYDRLGAGDKLAVRIWESGTATVFSSTAGGGDLGELVVDEGGRIYLPYVGAVNARGLTVAQLRSVIAARLRTVVLNPQVDVRLVEHRSAMVSVLGAASKSGSFPIERGRTRLGQLLADVAPNGENPEMLEVLIRRGDTDAAARLAEIFSNSRLNIPLAPGDTILLREIKQNVTVLGAAGVQGQVPISSRTFSLLDALGAARGLNPDAANPRGVFLLRAPEGAGSVPIVYQYDMRQPGAVALASRTMLSDKDAVLISSAPYAQLRLVLSSFAQSLAAVRSAATVPLP